MYAITLTYVNLSTGAIQHYPVKRRYPTELCAYRAAQQFSYQCKPDGNTLTGHCTANVQAVAS